MDASATAPAQNIETPLLGGHPALDLVNTLHWRKTDRPLETLVSYPDVLTFARGIGELSDQESRRALEAAAADPIRSADALSHLVRTREVLYRVFTAIAAGLEPPEPDFTELRKANADALEHGALVAREEGFAMTWANTDVERRVARPLAHKAFQLLLSSEHQRVKQCHDEGCGWLFLDHSKNASRRWCSMDICGSRAKSRAHYRRVKRQKG